MEKKIALVTGASRGIGRAVAVALGAQGCHVLVHFRSRRADAEQTLTLIQNQGGTGTLCSFNVADAADCSRALTELLQTHQRVDILINNAGLRQDGLMVFMKPEQWSEIIATNLNSFFHVTQPVVKQMAMRRWGRVVSIASTAGQTGVEGQTNYSAAKAGLIGASNSLAKEVAKRGVTVNVLAPGFIETDMTAGLPREQLLAQIPAGRFGRAEEVAAAAAFLCSDSAGYINGAVLNINGGVFT